MNKKNLIIGGVVIVVILVIVFMTGNTDNVTTDGETTNNSSTVDDNNSVTEVEIDESLTGKELIESLNYEAPKTMQCDYKVTNLEDETSSDSVLYYKDSSTRIETTNEEGEYIIIYNNKDKATYMYDPSTKIGTLINDTEEDSGEEDFNIGFFEEDYDVVRVEELNGEKVIYTEENDDYTSSTKTYHSAKTGIPLLIESYEDGVLISKQEISNIKLNKNISDSLFEKPSDVEFSDIDSMFDFDF